MRRLTEKNPGCMGGYGIKAANLAWHRAIKDKEGNVTYYGEHVNKLAEYEDMEEQGKLLKLPCAPDSGNKRFHGERFHNEWYEKGYNDGIADALNNMGADDIIGHIGAMAQEEIRKIAAAVRDAGL